ncbi:DUF5777 family beta-barrel protein [Bacteroidota bacterium]
MKKQVYKGAILLFVSFLMCTFSVNLFSQEEVTEEKPKEKPVRSLFESGLLIDNPTPINTRKGSFELMIKHRFGTFADKWDNLYGVYGTSNIYMGVNYGITNRLSVGFATEKYNKMQELSYKYTILNQTRSGSSPVAICYYGNIGLDANKEEFFGAEYKFIHRLSYFNQLLIARKFNEKLSVQLAPSFTHFNQVDSIYENDVFGISGGGRYKFWGDKSFIFEYSHPMPLKDFSNSENEPKPNMSFGIEIGTSTHNFQVFVANFDQIVSQKNYLKNQHEINNEGLLIGFNILIRLN